MLTNDLPEHLRERVSTNQVSSGRAGEFVLYWMHHAVRASENPALDVALHAAHALRQPLLVYQGLGGNHRYYSDRHHTFILEGARDVSARLAQRGIRHVFHLSTNPGAATPLRALATRASLVVTEYFPVAPFPEWSAALARRANVPVWRIDTACVLPMRLVAHAYGRAFEFRRAWGRELERRAALHWPSPAVPVSAFDGRLGFTAVDWAVADIAELCAACRIDHSIGPVPDTRGGESAGELRWQAFRENGLASYDRFRNDPLVPSPRGVSRISPYLHHGHLSPLRIAREASAHRSSGARKFLDELLTWRELAHNFCYQLADNTRRLESLDVLPNWAHESLIQHAGDSREREYSWERLARGATDDALWNAAQASLRVHGELHNNVRMTWGKAPLRWADPQAALDLLIDLNHRFALDGCDPNSYGGLLWCLGLFDRPFKPPRAIYGNVRTRPTSGHAERLDVPAFDVRVRRRTVRPEPKIAVVGAGISGLAAARTLNDQGFAVQVFERARSVGGRMATRSSAPGTFDHGAQYFTVRDPLFRRHVESWAQENCVAVWNGRIAASSGKNAGHRYVGVPGMRAVAEHLAEDLNVHLATPMETLARSGQNWQLAESHFNAVVLALPPEQAAPLLAGMPELGRRLAKVRSQPCWAAMASFSDTIAAAFDAAFIDQPPLAWVARDSSKPGRGEGERWVLHAAPDWSRAHIDNASDAIAETLLDAFFEALRLPRRTPTHLTGHRWRFARVDQGLGEDCLWDSASRLAVCGDWCRSARVEDAFLSGVAAAARIVNALTA